MIRRIGNIFIALIFICAFSLSALVAYWLFCPYDLITFNEPYTTTKTEYKRGEILGINVDITQNTNGVYCKVLRSLENGIIYNFSDDARPGYVTEKGRKVYINVSTIVPMEIVPGTYRYKATTICYPNPLRTITIVRVTNEFEIVE